jgi:hypothetical protein
MRVHVATATYCEEWTCCKVTPVDVTPLVLDFWGWSVVAGAWSSVVGGVLALRSATVNWMSPGMGAGASDPVDATVAVGGARRSRSS